MLKDDVTVDYIAALNGHIASSLPLFLHASSSAKEYFAFVVKLGFKGHPPRGTSSNSIQEKQRKWNISCSISYADFFFFPVILQC